MAYSAALFKLTLLDDWGTIQAGIHDLPIEGIKIGAVCFLPYPGITYFVWTWQSLSRPGFWAMVGLMTYMVLVGPTAYVYLLRLHAINSIVVPNDQWLRFSVVCGIFGVLMSGLYGLRFLARKMDLAVADEDASSAQE